MDRGVSTRDDVVGSRDGVACRAGRSGAGATSTGLAKPRPDPSDPRCARRHLAKCRALLLEWRRVLASIAGVRVAADEELDVVEVVGTEVESTRLAGEFPENWVRCPTENQWKAARDEADTRGLENFKGGLGEVLDDGKIIGAADDLPNGANLGAFIHSERLLRTRIEIRPERRERDPRLNHIVIPAEYNFETTFATRIVIVPPEIPPDN